MSETTKAARQRASTFTGKALRPLVDSNPRRPGTAGHASFQIILDRPGISAEEFRAHGGRLNDLHWDVRKGHVEAA